VPTITVVGSVNLDLMARVPRLPGPGETLEAPTFDRLPGGKGANQALAARRLGAEVRLIAAVGDDPFATEALALLHDGGVELSGVRTVGEHTGLAMITVQEGGETTIVMGIGANAAVRAPSADDLIGADAVLTVLEVPEAAVVAAATHTAGMFVLNAAPPRPVPAEVIARADLVVANRAEFDAVPELARARRLAVTSGAEGAVLLRGGSEVARAAPPPVNAVDGTGAGDAFTAALTLAMLGGLGDEAALRRACAAGALAATRWGAQPAMPTEAELASLVGPPGP
jgi:ribokinase